MIAVERFMYCVFLENVGGSKIQTYPGTESLVLHRAGPGSKPRARAGLEEAQGSGNPEPDPQVRAGPGRARPRAKAQASCGQYIE